MLPNKLVKSILNRDTPEKADGKLLRKLYDTMQNRMRTLESLGLIITLVCLWCYCLSSKQSCPVSLRRNGSLELTKYESEDEEKEIFEDFCAR